MAVRKITISLPDRTLERIDHLAEQAGRARSRFIAEVLDRVALSSRDAEITRRIDELFADPQIAAEQKETAEKFAHAAWSEDVW